jgi:GNAT superfamily N-acetyltransferase
MIRPARFDDLAGIVRLHHEDSGADPWTDETWPRYEAAFREILASTRERIFVMEAAGDIVGTCQIVLIRGLTGGGALRAKLEAVRVRGDRRSRGLGRQLLAFAENVAREAGASSMELISAKRREDAHRFYIGQGYAATHEGLRKRL